MLRDGWKDGAGPMQPIQILQPDSDGYLATALERLLDRLLPIALECGDVHSRPRSRQRFKAVVRKVIQARQRVACLRGVVNTLLAPRIRDMDAQLEEIATSKKLRQENVKRFLENYRQPQLSREVPVGQVTEDMTTKPLLETQCRFWQVADKAAGKVPECRGEPRQSDSKQSWIARGARERRPQRWGLAERLRRPEPAVSQWDVMSSGLKHFSAAQKVQKVELGLTKSTSLPSLHSKHGGFGKVDETCETCDEAPMATTFTDSWKAKQKSGGSMSRYMTACERGNILPKPLDFIASGSASLNAANWGLADSDLIPVVTMFRSASFVQEVDLSANTLLTDKSLVPLLQKMMRNAACQGMARLKLRQCWRLGAPAVEAVIGLLSSCWGLTGLKLLDFSGVLIPVRLQLDFCEAIGEHPNLTSVKLADTGLGSNPAARSCLEALFRCNTLTALDLSWNAFKDEVFVAIGSFVAASHVHLQSLAMSNCSSANLSLSSEQVQPANLMLERLGQAQRLSYLDVSMNRLDLSGALVLEDALGRHPTLTELDVSRNSFSKLGAHSLLRLFASSRLERLHCAESFDMGTSGRFFQLCNPEGEYSLNLSLPHHRSILRMLLKLCKRLRLTVKQAFIDMQPLLTLPDQEEDGVFRVPSSGRVSFTFSSTRAAGPDVYEEPARLDAALQDRLELCRVQLRVDKAVLMIPIFESLQDKLPLIDALAKNFILSYAHVEMLCSLGKSMLAPTVILRLLHTTAASKLCRYMCLLLAGSKAQYIQIQKRARLSLTFTPSNPSMHYLLILSEACDFHLAESIRILDRWESNCATRCGLVDNSQSGNQSQVRNELYEGRKPCFRSLGDWELPLQGRLEFDFAGGPRPRPGTEPAPAGSFNKLFEVVLHSGCKPKQQLQALRAVSPYIYVSSSQLRASAAQLLGSVCVPQDTKDKKDAAETAKEVRLQLFHIFYYRLTDIWNVKVCKARFSSEEYTSLTTRLGPVKFLPFVQPEQALLELDFAIHDHKLAVSIFVMLCQKEGALFQEPRFIREDGTEDKLVTGVPRAWARYSDCPKAGFFRAKYAVAPEKRSVKTRTEFLATYGRWRAPALAKEDICWWSQLSDVSLDVIRFLEVICEKYPDLKEAFRDIDGEGGNGGISILEFEEYCERVVDSRFSKNRRDRFRAIFRFLDATMEGNISMEEWGLLDTVKCELDRQTHDLHAFLLHRFKGGLEQAWDAWATSRITQEQWKRQLDEAGYFGASAELFSIMDQPNAGSISYDQFRRFFSGRSTRDGCAKS
ncbi:unnamed protein product [Effrenium voratum]|uniref:EF-hand domain-containing protein n=1 Tax=Effrenium voratum TaxID=2562239 RepID=A0AA36JNV1_9DINO|nr:unnamed protein product [Effrenium voratum]